MQKTIKHTIGKFNNYIQIIRLLIISLPYIIISSIDSTLFLKNVVPILIPILVLIDYALYKIKIKTFYFILSFLFTYILYSLIVYKETYYILHELRFRTFSLIFCSLIFLVFIIQVYYQKNASFFNTVLLIFSITQFINFDRELSVNKILSDYKIKLTNKKIDVIDKNEKPVILIICDALTDTSEIFEISQNDLDLEFDRFLLTNNYHIKPKFKSHSIWTQFSLSSMLNFNFHNNDTVIKLEKLSENKVFEKDFWTLIKSNKLVDSLNNMGVKSYSLGVLPFVNGEKNESSFFYLWEKINFNYDIQFLENNIFFKLLFHKSALNFIDSRFLNGRTYVFDSHRKNILAYLQNTKFKKNSFYYFHYYGPHSPFSYFNEFIIENNNDTPEDILKNHILYRRFMLKKLTAVLKLPKFSKTRVIITGDHGFRNERTDNFVTMGAFKGYEKKTIEQVSSPQDIGSLILRSFEKSN